MRVLLAHPYIPARFNGAPMGLLYLAAHLQERGHHVSILDLQAIGSNDRFEFEMVAQNPDVVGISATSPSHKAAVALANCAKQQKPDVIVVKGGVHETYCGRHTISNVPSIDFSVGGEADYSFSSLLDSIIQSSSFETIPGITYRCHGHVVTTKAKNRPIDLSAAPRLPRELLGEKCNYNFKIFGGLNTAQVQTMRGCPFQCSFCNQRNQVVNYADNGAILNELAALKSEGYEAIFFDDATFTVSPKRTASLMRDIRKQGLGLTYAAQTRSQCVNDELVREMSSAGFQYLSFGLETADEDALLNILKSRSPQRHLDGTIHAVKSCKNYGIDTCLNIIVGMPRETDKSLLRTFEFVENVDPTFVSLSALALYPHESPETAQRYHDGVSEEGIWRNFDEGYGAVHPFLTSERAAELLQLAQRELGSRLELV